MSDGILRKNGRFYYVVGCKRMSEKPAGLNSIYDKIGVLDLEP
jgi:hypothetical protein